MTSVLPTVLNTARDSIDPLLASAVRRLDAETRRVCEYHLGWTEVDGSPGAGGGKALRPALVLLSARAEVPTVPDEEAVPAAAVELVHNFSLLHDDVMDADTARRHRPTAWTVFGRPAALLAGDALLALSNELLLESASRWSVPAVRALSEATRTLIAGQSADLDFERRQDVTLSECLRMTHDKTAALLGCATSLGALFQGADVDTVRRLRRFGIELGMAFQLVDDLLGLWGDPEITGKPVLSDLRARKKTLPVVHALSSNTRCGERLRALYDKPDPFTEDQLHESAEMVHRAGSEEWSRAECERRLVAACDHLPPTESGISASLTELAEFIVRRQR